MASFSLLSTALIFYQVPYLELQGLSAARAASNFSITAVAMAIAFPVMGWLLDRLSTRLMVSMHA